MKYNSIPSIGNTSLILYTIYEPLSQARASKGARQAWERADLNGEGTPEASLGHFADAEAIVQAVPVETIATIMQDTVVYPANKYVGPGFGSRMSLSPEATAMSPTNGADV